MSTEMMVKFPVSPPPEAATAAVPVLFWNTTTTTTTADGNGNRTEKQGYVWDGDQKTSYAYDPAGNRIQKEKEGEIHRYFYNTRNQLVSMEESGEERTRYQYDNLQHLVCHQNYID